LPRLRRVRDCHFGVFHDGLLWKTHAPCQLLPDVEEYSRPNALCIPLSRSGIYDHVPSLTAFNLRRNSAGYFHFITLPASTLNQPPLPRWLPMPLDAYIQRFGNHASICPSPAQTQGPCPAK
jgi:hypothetical protein